MEGSIEAWRARKEKASRTLHIIVNATLPDNFSFFENMKRIGERGYMPNQQDMLQTQVRTTGIAEIAFKMEDYIIRFGINSEIRKFLEVPDFYWG